jgi:hypothetical protein
LFDIPDLDEKLLVVSFFIDKIYNLPVVNSTIQHSSKFPNFEVSKKRTKRNLPLRIIKNTVEIKI